VKINENSKKNYENAFSIHVTYEKNYMAALAFLVFFI
jgi:hypothetical protein